LFNLTQGVEELTIIKLNINCNNDKKYFMGSKYDKIYDYKDHKVKNTNDNNEIKKMRIKIKKSW
jgi:hypothetical protein